MTGRNQVVTDNNMEVYVDKVVESRESSSVVIQVDCAAAAAVVVIGNQHFSVFVSPEAVEVDEDAGDNVALAAVDEILESDLIGVFGLYHVKDLILRTKKGQTVNFQQRLKECSLFGVFECTFTSWKDTGSCPWSFICSWMA